ncbi:MAG: ABC transporter ATP-binding protein, partial [Verrucomicrobiota bacterium]
LKPYRMRFAMGVLCGALASAINAASLLVMKKVADEMFHGGGAAAAGAKLVKGFSDTGDIRSVIWIAALIPLIMIVRVTFEYLQTYCMSWVSMRVLNDIQTNLFDHLVRQSLDFFNRSQSGSLISTVANETRMAQAALTTVTSDVILKPFTIIGAVSILLYLDWKFTLVSLCLFPLCLVPIISFGKRARRNAKAQQQSQRGITVILSEAFAGIRVIKAFSREKFESDRFAAMNKALFGQAMRVRRSVEIVGPTIEGISAVGAGFALVYVYYKGMSAGTFLALIYGMTQLYQPAKVLSKIHVNLQSALVATTRLFDLLNTKPTVQDRPDAKTLGRAKGEIKLENVSFSYSAAKDRIPALTDASLLIPAGKTYALVGQSGAGKTTVISLLLRLYDPTAGRILIDGSDLREFTQESLRNNIGIVSQDTFLFHDTIYKNILYGRLDATPEEVYEAARLAYAHDFILAQPKGYDTIIGDKGSLLSGGQQQRVSIARALLKNAPVLLLDEATSALDSESEKQIQQALETLSAGRTVIAIAHRLSTVLKADSIVVMSNGQILDTGPHAELYEKSEAYRQLYNLQFNSHEEAAADTPQIASSPIL